MGKPGKESQEIFGKIEIEEQRILFAERKRKQRTKIKSNKKKYQEHLEKDRMGKRKQKEEVSVNLCTDRIPTN